MKNRTILSILGLAILLLGIPSASVAGPSADSYLVKPGDTLYSVARSLGVQMQALQTANGIADPSFIRVGQVLTIPGSGETAQASSPASSAAVETYVVKSGDTLYSIARSLGVRMQALRDSNGIADPSRIRVGQVLTIPGAAPMAQVAGTSPTPQPAATPVPGEVAPVASGVYRAKSPEYGMNIFIMGAPSTTSRDLQKVKDAGFTWQKTLFQWRQIEGAAKGQFNWSESDRVVAATNSSGIKTIARLDFQPGWARADGANNGPPDRLSDYGDFVYAFVSRYKTASPYGRVPAIELWNEPNLAREWGDKAPSPREYVALLKVGYEAAKRADPNVTVITAGLTPTESWSADAMPDDVFLQQMYDAGASQYFDVLGAHGAGYKAPPEMSPDQVAADPSYGGHRFFCFRRIEDLRNVMTRNGDSGKQIWLLEFGWTSDTVHPAYAWHAVSEDQKADYIVRAYKYAQMNWSSWIGVMTLWNLPAPDWTTEREEYWWSIANADGSNRAAYTKVQQARQTGYLP